METISSMIPIASLPADGMPMPENRSLAGIEPNGRLVWSWNYLSKDNSIFAGVRLRENGKRFGIWAMDPGLRDHRGFSPLKPILVRVSKKSLLQNA